MLVKYNNGNITAITKPTRCDLFKRGCKVTLTAKDSIITAETKNDNVENGIQILSSVMPHPNDYGGFHLQHTGSTGASATVIKRITLQ